MAISSVFMVVFVQYASASAAEKPNRKVHIVYIGEVPTHEAGDWKEIGATAHHDMMESILGSFNGFAATLSAAEVEAITNMDGVVSVFENRRMVLHTRSWDFIGLPSSAKRNLQYERNIIIGMFDTGIRHESESFKDTGLGPVRSKWKGTCETASSSHFTCNREMIGGRIYYKGVDIVLTRREMIGGK